MTDIETCIYEIICDIIRSKRKENRFPAYAFDIEIFDIASASIHDIKNTLNNLVKKNKIAFHRTINHIGFDLVE